MHFGHNAIAQGVQTTIAVSKDFILSAQGTNEVNVLCQGVFAGSIEREDHGYVYTPSEGDPPICQRTAFKLQKEGLLCL